MNVIGHDDEFVQFDCGKTLRKRLPCIFHDVTHLGNLKIWLTSLQAYCDEIGSRLAIIIALETNRTSMVLFRVVTHGHIAPSEGIYMYRCIYLFLYPLHGKSGKSRRL